MSPTSRRDVRDAYDRIAHHFAETRPSPWSEVEAFLRDRGGDVGLDVGVGNGRHAALLAEGCSTVVGVDASRAALGEAAARSRSHYFDLELVLADASDLPIRDRRVDVVVYVATIHHLPSRDLRVASLDELARVLRPTGRAIVSGWSVTHDRFDADEGFDTTVDWTLPDGTVVERYYHIYDGEEFASEVAESGLRRIEIFESRGNWYAVVGAGGEQ